VPRRSPHPRGNESRLCRRVFFGTLLFPVLGFFDVIFFAFLRRRRTSRMPHVGTRAALQSTELKSKALASERSSTPISLRLPPSTLLALRP
jgi:hypothetical protein